MMRAIGAFLVRSRDRAMAGCTAGFGLLPVAHLSACARTHSLLVRRGFSAFSGGKCPSSALHGLAWSRQAFAESRAKSSWRPFSTQGLPPSSDRSKSSSPPVPPSSYVADPAEEEASRTRVWTVPNALSLLRMALGPVIAHSIFSGDFTAAVAMLGFAGGLDWADGFVARKFKGQASLLGSFLDPLGDKVLMACTGLPLAMIGALHPLLVFVVVGRDALLVAGSLVYRWRKREPGEPFFSLSRVTYRVEPSTLSKVNTGMQIGLVFTSIASLAWPHVGLVLDAATLSELPQWLQDASTSLPLPSQTNAAETSSAVDTASSAAFASDASAVAATSSGTTSGSDSGAGASRLLTLAPAVTALSWLVGTTTIATGFDYLFKSGMGFGRVGRK